VNNLLTLPPATTRAGRTSPEARRLAVAGWTPEAQAALDALTATGRYEGAGIADTSGAALVSAQSGTGLPCHQQVWNYLQHATYDAILASGDLAIDAARSAVSQEAELLLLTETVSTAQLSAIADILEAHSREAEAGARVALVQPAMQESGFAQLTQLVTAMDGWAPHYLDITVEGATDPERLLGIAVGQFAHLSPNRAVSVTAEPSGYPMRSVSIGIESPDCRTRITVRHAPTAYMRITGDAEAGAFEWRLTETDVSLARTDADGSRLAYEPPAVSHWDAEAQRIATGNTDSDASLLKRTALLLEAVQRAAASGEAQSTGCCSRAERPAPKPEAWPRSARPPYLRLITS